MLLSTLVMNVISIVIFQRQSLYANKNYLKPNSEPYEIRENEELGRYLVATRNLNARSVIIRETPLVCGPADDDRDETLGEIPMCLGCFARMNANQETRCSKCGWPVCEARCEKISHHRDNECKFFRQNNISYPPCHTWPIINKSILVLRCLILKQRNPRSWHEVILKLEPHTAVRQTKPYCVKGDEMILDNLRYFLICSGYESEDYLPLPDYDEKEIIRISGVINVNAFITMKYEEKYNHVTIVQCMFARASLCAHSCKPNATWSVGNRPDFEMTITATVPIKKGETIAIAYSMNDNMLGTLQRIFQTEDVAHFICKCARCRSPTELGTYVSAIKCFSCEEDYLLPKDSTEPDSVWVCRGCEYKQSVQKIVFFVYKIEQRFEYIKSQGYSKEIEVEKLEQLYKSKINSVLHQNHYLLQQISMRIVKLQAFSLYSLDEERLERFVFHAKFLLRIADVLAPGYCKHRAVLQFHLSQGMLRKARLQQNELDIEDGCEKLAHPYEMYKTIYDLQKEALLYFENSHNYTPMDGVNQYVVRLRKQMTETEEYLQTEVN